MEFEAEEPLDRFNDKHEIFPMRSPVDALDPPKLPSLLSKSTGRLAQLANSRSDGLLAARETLNKVYADSYFENHYPDADRKLKKVLHAKTMKAWEDVENAAPKSGGNKITLTISLGD